VKSWSRPWVPRLPGNGQPPRLFDTSTSTFVSTVTSGTASLYVCGITPYDATHLGHASTYLAFDILVRSWLDAGYDVDYVQNTTDVDDPLLERATLLGIDWRELAESQTELFRGDMAALSIIPPDHYVPVTAVIPEVAAAVDALVVSGFAYEVPSAESIDSAPDLYFDSTEAGETTSWHLGLESNLDRADMLALFAERGGDPDRPGKRDPLDPLLWRAARAGEPVWDTVLGLGRPGWHIECSVIAVNRLGSSITVQGGGADLLFPHHEFSAAHATALTGEPFARIYSHAGMIAYEGEKMSKSLGNLVLVSRLIEGGADPRAIRLALLGHHYRHDWEWTDDALVAAGNRLALWRAWAEREQPGAQATDFLITALRVALSNDLDTVAALDAVDRAVSTGHAPDTAALDAVHALLGIDLRS